MKIKNAKVMLAEKSTQPRRNQDYSMNLVVEMKELKKKLVTVTKLTVDDI